MLPNIYTLYTYNVVKVIIREWRVTKCSVSSGQFHNICLASTKKYFSNPTKNVNKIYFALRGGCTSLLVPNE